MTSSAAHESPFEHQNAQHPELPGRTPMPPGCVRTYLLEAILVMLLCNPVLGLFALVYGSRVNARLAEGDYWGAVSSSRAARLWCLGAVVFALLCQGSGLFLLSLLP